MLCLATTAIFLIVNVTLAALDADRQSANMLNYGVGNGKHYTLGKKKNLHVGNVLWPRLVPKFLNYLLMCSSSSGTHSTVVLYWTTWSCFLGATRGRICAPKDSIFSWNRENHSSTRQVLPTQISFPGPGVPSALPWSRAHGEILHPLMSSFPPTASL